MQLEINPGGGIETSTALEAHIREKLSVVERRFGSRITRIEAYLKDTNGHKGGIDSVCTLEAHPAGLKPVAVESEATDIYSASHDAAKKLEKAIEHRIARAKHHSRD